MEAFSAAAIFIQQNKVRRAFQMYKLLFMPSPDKDVSYEHRPNVDLDFKSAKTDTTMRVKTNALGLREDRDIPFEKPEGAVRIIGLGDSVMFGSSVDNDETMLKWIEKCGTEKNLKIETLNYGLGSSNLYHEYHYFIYKKGLEYKPDILLLGFVYNDFMNRCLYFEENLGNWVKCGETPGKQSGKPKGIKFFLKKFAIVNFLDAIKDSIQIKLGVKPCAGYEDPPEIVQGMKKSVRPFLDRIVKLAKENNIKLVMVIMPMEDQMKCMVAGNHKIFLAWWQAIREINDELGINYYDPSFDMAQIIRKSKYKMSQVYWDDTHPYKLGHKILGRLIFNYLIEKGYIKNSPQSEYVQK